MGSSIYPLLVKCKLPFGPSGNLTQLPMAFDDFPILQMVMFQFANCYCNIARG